MGRLLLLCGEGVDFDSVGWEEQLEHRIVDTGFDGVFGRVRRDLIVGHQGFDLGVILKWRSAVVLVLVVPGDLEGLVLRQGLSDFLCQFVVPIADDARRRHL